MTTQDSRILIKTSTTTGQVPSIPSSSNHLDGTWIATDIYKQELMLNITDDKFWYRGNNGIVEIPTIKRAQANSYNYASASGTDTYTVTLTPALTAYTAGNTFNILFANANTGGSTINVNGLGTRSILSETGLALSANDITAGAIHTVVYDGSAFRLKQIPVDSYSNGLTVNSNVAKLGGTLTGNTTIDAVAYNFTQTGSVVEALTNNGNSSSTGYRLRIVDTVNGEDKELNLTRDKTFLNNISTDGTFYFGYDGSGSYSEWKQTNAAVTYRSTFANYSLGFFNGFSHAVDDLGSGDITQMVNAFEGFSLSYDNFSRFAVKVDRTNPNGEGIFQSLPTYNYTTNADTSNGIIGVNSTGEFFRTGVTAAQLASLVSGGVTSVTGTTNRITSTGGTTPVIDISASYVGQTSITTLGTIGTGVWNGSAVAPTYGGTGLNTYTTGDLLYSNASNSLAKLAAVSSGSYLRSAGTSTAPVWSTYKLPNSGTANYILYNSSTDTMGSSDQFQYDGTRLYIGGVTTGTYPGNRLRINSTGTSGETISIYNTTTTAYTGFALEQSSTNLMGFVKFNSAYVGNLGGTSLPLANSAALYSGSTYLTPMYFVGEPIINAIGTTSTYKATRLDRTGFRICTAATAHNSNTVGFEIDDAIDLKLGTTTGTKIGTATSQKIGFWNTTPVVQQTTASSGATFVSNGGTTITSTDTFDGYTLAQIVKILRTIGITA